MEDNMLIRCIYVLQKVYHHSISKHLHPILNFFFFFFVVRTLRMYCLSNFQVNNTGLLAMVIMQYIKSLELVNPIAGSLYPLNNRQTFCILTSSRVMP